MPNSYTPVTTSDVKTGFNQINNNFRKLDSEAITKKFGSGDNTVIIGKIGDLTGTQFGDITVNGIFQGRYQENPARFGTLYYQDGVPVALDGQAPDDGRVGHWTVKTGKNVLTELGG